MMDERDWERVREVIAREREGLRVTRVLRKRSDGVWIQKEIIDVHPNADGMTVVIR